MTMRRGYGRNYRGRTEMPRLIVGRYAGECCSCGGAIAAGEVVTWWPAKRAISHAYAQDGDKSRCPRRQISADHVAVDHDPGYVDPGELAEDRWNETHGDGRF